jgi:hypothetical protein
MERPTKNSKFNLYFPLHASKRSKTVSVDHDIVNERTHQSILEAEQSVENLNDNRIMETERVTFQRVSLVDSECKISLVDETYNIMLLVQSVLRHLTNPINVLESDDQVALFEESDISKGKWAREYYSICNKFHISKIAQREILNLMYNTWGQSTNLPIKLTKLGQSNLRRQLCDTEVSNEDDDVSDNNFIGDRLSAPNTMSQINNYTRKASRWIKFHQCVDDCCVFVGELANSFYCSNSDCQKPRFRPCARSTCEGRGQKSDCEHLLNDGVENKSLHYRLLIPLFVDLLNTKYFVTALNYRNDLTISGLTESYYTDILDGSVAKEHLEGMNDNFKAWCNENEANSNATPINLLLMDFYDGGQLFTWKACNFWGFFTSIVNLPPAYRGKLGISTFLTAIYGGKHLKAERFLFVDLYCEELRALYKGFEYVGNNGQRFFIQARLILHCMDTKAQEPVLNMQSMSNSRYGCPYCRNAHGQHNSWKVFYSGNRQFLPIHHYLRYFGQSGACCPNGFYLPESKQWFDDEGFKSHTVPVTAESLTRKNKKMEFCRPCDNDTDRHEQIKEFLLDDKASYIWHHRDTGFDFEDISKPTGGIRDHIFYRHFDFRPQVFYRRITKEEHLQSASEARAQNHSRAQNKKRIIVDGFYDIWPFERLPYSDFARNSSPPPDHAIKGMVKRCFEYMFGIYKEKKPSRRKYKKKGNNEESKQDDTEFREHAIEDEHEDGGFVPIYRPSYHEEKAPYSCTTKDFELCHAWLLCVLIPIGIPGRSDWVMNIKNHGLFKIDQWKNLVLVYWDFILSILVGINQWYKLLFRMFADKVRKLFSYNVAKDSIEQLQQEVNEMICLWESFFTASENYFQLHQIMDLVSSITLFGPIHAWSELSGEKALGLLKNIKKKATLVAFHMKDI